MPSSHESSDAGVRVGAETDPLVGPPPIPRKALFSLVAQHASK